MRIKDTFTIRKTILATLAVLVHLLANAQVPDQSWWSFTYPGDKPASNSQLDLRYLNEKFAGSDGFLKLSKDGNNLVNGKGKEMRFWACNGGSLANEFSDAQLDTLARFLSKIGVNLVRFHGAVNPHGKNTKLNEPSTEEINNIWRCVAAMKKQGIYTVISPFWPHNGHMGGWIPEEWGIEGYSGKDELWAVMYFNDKLKEAYKSWVRVLYGKTNPYTGIALKDDPAVALIQVENEDGIFFWTMGDIKPALAKMAGKQFSEWLKQKYGSLEAAKQHWDGTSHKDDDFSNNITGLFHIYELTIAQKNGMAKRIQDQTEFYARRQRSFYDEMVRYYRDTLGCKQLINGNNWRTASQSRLLDLERWTNSGAEVIAANKYFDPGHKGPEAGWRIDPGDFYSSPSALKNPADLPTNVKHVAGHPMMITESGWNLPNKYQTEGPLLVAAYGGLTGLDAFFWFCPTATTYAAEPYYTFLNVQGQHPLSRWTTSTPGEMAMFPANALIHRLGYVKKGQIAEEQRSLDAMLKRTIPQIFEEQPFDPNRDFFLPNKQKESKPEHSPLLFLTGGISTRYESKTDTLKLHADPGTLISTTTQTVTSVTSEQNLDYKNGVFTLNTPKAKAVSGFLNTRTVFDLGEVQVRSENEYATIELVSMDDRDIGNSKKILLQTGTLFRPRGWQEEPAINEQDQEKPEGYKILNTGTMPWMGMPAKGTISIRNKNLKKATQLDAAGYPRKPLSLQKTKNSVSLDLPSDALYILLE